LRGRLWDWPRRLSNFLVPFDPMMKATFSYASQIVVTTNETLRELPSGYRAKTRVQSTIGIDPEGFQPPNHATASPGSARLNLLFAGRLLPWKGLHLGLRAMAGLGSEIKKVHLTVIGSGSDETRLKRLAQHLNIEQFVTWIPWMDRKDLIHFYSRFNLFLFPSLHDSGGLAVLEAMNFGVPVLCLDLGGPAMSVDDSCGRVISTEKQTEEEVVRRMSDCLSALLSNRSTLDSLSKAARVRAASLTWQAVVARTYDSFPASQ